MGFLLALYNRYFPEDEVDLDPEFEAYADKQIEAFAPMCEPTVLDRSATIVQDFLTHARTDKARLEGAIRAERDQHAQCISDLTEELRRTNVAIAAFEPVLPKLVEGYDSADDAKKSYDAAIVAKQKRGDRHYRKPALQAAE